MSITDHLEAADIVPLALAVVQMSGDATLLDALAPHIRGPWDGQATVPDTLAADIRKRAEVLLRTGGAVEGSTIEGGLLKRMMTVAAGEPVADPYVPMFLEHVLPGLKASNGRRLSQHGENAAAGTSMRAIIIGAGASGLCAAVRLGELGIPYVVLEKNGDLGGTWFENRYPGCAVDLPSHHYEFSFARSEDWPDYYSKQEAVLAYLRRCAERFGIRKHVRFGLEATGAVYDEAAKSWTVTARTDGVTEKFCADVLIAAVGQLNLPLVPKLEGLQTFKGRHFHTARWPEELDLTDKRVGLVGTGPSAVQVAPAIAGKVKDLRIFQRSGNWVMKRPRIRQSVSPSTSWLLRNVPYYSEWFRFRLFWAFGDSALEAFKVDPAWSGRTDAISEINAKYRSTFVRYIERELDGRQDLLANAIPPYPPFCRRVIADPGWYATLRLPNVKLVDAEIGRVFEGGIETMDGSRLLLDYIIFATGFRADQMLSTIDIRGKGGQSLRSRWGEDDPRAYLGITVPGFPNLFLLYGPNSNFAHGGSAIFMAECQTNYIASVLEQMVRNGYTSVDIRADVHDRYNKRLDEELASFAWGYGSPPSWYKNRKGRVVANQPWRLVDYWSLTRRAVLEEYVSTR